MTEASPPSSWDPTNPPTANDAAPGFVRDFLRFAWQEKWWWIVPMLLIVGLLGVMLFAAQGNQIAPFFYALF